MPLLHSLDKMNFFRNGSFRYDGDCLARITKGYQRTCLCVSVRICNNAYDLWTLTSVKKNIIGKYVLNYSQVTSAIFQYKITIYQSENIGMIITNNARKNPQKTKTKNWKKKKNANEENFNYFFRFLNLNQYSVTFVFANRSKVRPMRDFSEISTRIQEDLIWFAYFISSFVWPLLFFRKFYFLFGKNWFSYSWK